MKNYIQHRFRAQDFPVPRLHIISAAFLHFAKRYYVVSNDVYKFIPKYTYFGIRSVVVLYARRVQEHYTHTMMCLLICMTLIIKIFGKYALQFLSQINVCVGVTKHMPIFVEICHELYKYTFQALTKYYVSKVLCILFHKREGNNNLKKKLKFVKKRR